MPYISLLPNYSASNPDCEIKAILSTEWQKDELSGYGSYCNFQVGAKDASGDVEAMRRGVPERRLWFAGEHCAPFDEVCSKVSLNMILICERQILQRFKAMNCPADLYKVWDSSGCIFERRGRCCPYIEAVWYYKSHHLEVKSILRPQVGAFGSNFQLNPIIFQESIDAFDKNTVQESTCVTKPQIVKRNWEDQCNCPFPTKPKRRFTSFHLQSQEC